MCVDRCVHMCVQHRLSWKYRIRGEGEGGVIPRGGFPGGGYRHCPQEGAPSQGLGTRAQGRRKRDRALLGRWLPTSTSGLALELSGYWGGGLRGASPGGGWALCSSMGSHSASCSFTPPAATFSPHGKEAAWFTPHPVPGPRFPPHLQLAPGPGWPGIQRGWPPSQAATSPSLLKDTAAERGHGEISIRKMGKGKRWNSPRRRQRPCLASELHPTLLAF